MAVSYAIYERMTELWRSSGEAFNFSDRLGIHTEGYLRRAFVENGYYEWGSRRDSTCAGFDQK